MYITSYVQSLMKTKLLIEANSKSYTVNFLPQLVFYFSFYEMWQTFILDRSFSHFMTILDDFVGIPCRLHQTGSLHRMPA